ncbi:MAG TPA: pyrroloquinoline quinone-dependent dehydrogenase [Gemmatimonadales bacterium]|nr:pyrroloquinoline quinone-dependent dehydrogenase [Gemmatimonadales bacterium]
MNAALLLALTALQSPGDWPVYGHDAAGSRHSPLAQINQSNVKQLRLAWAYRTGDMMRDRSRFEATPIVVAGTMYLSTPLGRVIALDPARGIGRWRFDAQVSLDGDYGDFANRGVSTWFDRRARAGTACRRRIFVATVDARLIALDATTGNRCADFGAAGTVDLSRDLLNAPEYAGEYEVTSPPTVVGDLVIVGSSVADNHRTNAPNGVVRAYDARTGHERWSWDPIARAPGMPGAANAWSVFSADSARDLVFVPTGSASPDYYGGARLGDNRWANSVVALRASTGELVWGFQVVHHDLWDYDVPAQPVLFNLRRDGRQIPAVAVATKMGHLFVLDRLTGKPLFPVEERPVPTSDVPGEQTWPTQPFPADPFRLVPEGIRPEDAFGVTPETKEECRALIASFRSEGIFTPPALKGMIVFPGNLGGSNWSGVAIDEARGLIFAPTNRLAMVITLVPRDQLHAAHMAHPDVEVGRMAGAPYGMLRDLLWTPDHMVCVPPPWGTLAALDVNGPRVRWDTPLGQMPQVAGVPGSERWGSVNLGGAMVTGGGLVFIAATLDHHLRAFSEETGEELWSASLPAGGHALPMTYTAGGRQYVAIVAGGHDRLPSGQGDYVLAFTLPGAGAPAPDTTSGQAEGVYTAEFRIGGAKITGPLVVRAGGGDSLIGTLTTDSLTVSGPVAVRRAPSGLALTFSFHYPKKSCDGTIRGLGDYADGGRLVEGPFELSGGCVGDEGGRGAFSLWRR